MIDEKTIQHIAKLARLKITSEEAHYYGDQLTKVLNYFEQIEGVETEHIEPLVTPVEIQMHLREDQALQEVSSEELLQGAPDRMGNLFKVPPVVG